MVKLELHLAETLVADSGKEGETSPFVLVGRIEPGAPGMMSVCIEMGSGQCSVSSTHGFGSIPGHFRRPRVDMGLVVIDPEEDYMSLLRQIGQSVLALEQLGKIGGEPDVDFFPHRPIYKIRTG